MGATGALAVAALAATALGTGAVLPAGRVFALTFIGLLSGLATLAVARSRRGAPGRARRWPGWGWPVSRPAWRSPSTTWPSIPTYVHDGLTVSLPPLTAVVLAVTLAGCLGLALGRHAGWLTGPAAGSASPWPSSWSAAPCWPR